MFLSLWTYLLEYFKQRVLQCYVCLYGIIDIRHFFFLTYFNLLPFTVINNAYCSWRRSSSFFRTFIWKFTTTLNSSFRRSDTYFVVLSRNFTLGCTSYTQAYNYKQNKQILITTKTMVVETIKLLIAFTSLQRICILFQLLQCRSQLPVILTPGNLRYFPNFCLLTHKGQINSHMYTYIPSRIYL